MAEDVPKEKAEVDDHPDKSKKKDSNLQRIANVLTLVVALAAIGLSIWEGRENRLHNRLSVLPYLQQYVITIRDGLSDPDYRITYALKNTGLGPAVLKELYMYVDDELTFEGREEGQYIGFREVRAALQSSPYPITGLYTHGRFVGEMLEAGEEHIMFYFDVPAADSSGRYLPGIMKSEIVGRYSFVFCYCSVYGDNCKSQYLGSPPPESNVCNP